MDAAVAQIQVAFSRAAEIDAFKRRVERWLRLGPQHPAVRARFRARAAALSDWTLAAAICEVEGWWRGGVTVIPPYYARERGFRFCKPLKNKQYRPGTEAALDNYTYCTMYCTKEYR